MVDDLIQDTHLLEVGRVVVARVPLSEICTGSIILPGIIHLGRAEVVGKREVPGGTMLLTRASDYPRVALTWGPSMPVHIPYIPEVIMSTQPGLRLVPKPPADLDLHIRVEVVKGLKKGLQGWLVHGTLVTPGVVWIRTDQGEEREVEAGLCRVVTSTKEE